MSGSGKIVIKSADITAPPLFETSDAKTVEFRDAQGELTALLVRGILGADIWMFANKLDDDWQQVLVRFGYKDVRPDELKAIREGL